MSLLSGTLKESYHQKLLSDIFSLFYVDFENVIHFQLLVQFLILVGFKKMSVKPNIGLNLLSTIWTLDSEKICQTEHWIQIIVRGHKFESDVLFADKNLNPMFSLTDFFWVQYSNGGQ